VSRSAAFFASLLVSLGRPTWWLLALAGFLARGGIVLAVLPIVALPSPLGLSNMVAPVILPLALGRVDAAVVVAIAAVIVALASWLVLGGLIGAVTDLALIRDGIAAAREEGLTGLQGDDPEAEPLDDGRDGPIVRRILAVRLIAHIPSAVALSIGLVSIVNVTYAELTSPGDVATPLVVRVAARAARQIVAILVAWFLGEVAGGVAARRIVLDGDGVRTALGYAVAALVRQPRSTLVPALVTTAPLLAILGGTLGGARIAWLRADDVLADPATDGPTLGLTLMTFVGIWLAALTLIGLLAAVRSAALTFEAVRSAAERQRTTPAFGAPGDTDGGTFGASIQPRPGDRPIGDDGASL
jgi:hypothetical protein